MNLSELKAQFVALVNRRDLTASTALQQTFIDQAVMRVQRELRVPAMEKSVNVTIADPYTGLVIPNDFLELIRIVPSSTSIALRKCDLTRALVLAKTTDTPEEYSRQGGVWVLGPAPALAQIMRIDYYAELAPLVAPTDSNILTEIAWDLIVFAALVQAAIYYKDARQPTWEDQYQTIKAGLQGQADEDEEMGGAAVVPCYVFPDDNSDGCE